MRILSSDEYDRARVDAYVDAHAATPTDQSAWRDVVHEAYRLTSYPLAALEGDEVLGALTLYEVKHPVFGHYLATAPFGNDGGLQFETREAADALAAEARRLADRLDVDYLVIRGRDLKLDGFVVDDHYRSVRIDLQGGAEAVWKDRIPAKTRNQIRRGMKEGFVLATGPAELDAFLAVFHEHMRDLGSPAHRRRFYESIQKHFGDRAEFLVLRDGTSLVAGALLFHVNHTAVNLHTVALRPYNRRCPNYLMYWKMIEAAAARGCRWFDMGRSESGSSTLDFKLNWSSQVVTLTYNYYLRKLEKPPHLDPRNPRYRLPIAAWRRLPLFVTRGLGPRLIRGLV